MSYSKKITAFLSRKKLEPGCRVRVECNKGVFEGVLMPGLEESDCVVVKFDSGYNAGFSLDSIKSISLVAKGVFQKIPEFNAVEDDKLPLISLVATGGTIASRVDYGLGGVKAMLSPKQLLYFFPEVSKKARLRFSSPFSVMSEDMTPREWGRIAREVARHLNSGSVGCIVTHGTDTLHYTSAALSFMLIGLGKPVALVGAQRSPDRGSFDGWLNLVCGVNYCLSDLAGVAVVMHASTNDDFCLAIRGTKVRKMHTTRRDAFRPINDLPIARIWESGLIEVVNEGIEKRRAGKVKADPRFEERVALVKAYPGSEPKLIDFLVERKYKGIVIEATALGHVPTNPLDKKKSWIPSVRKAVEKGVVVCVTTQCFYGRVNPFVYSNLRALSGTGVVYLSDMLSETAFVKLGCMLARHKNVESVKNAMLENVAGEFNSRLTGREFLY